MTQLLATTAQLADLLGVDSPYLTRWKPLGIQDAVVSRNMWDVKKALSWWLENMHKPGNQVDSPTMQVERLRYEKSRADKMEVQVAMLKGEVIPKEQIHQDWAARMAIIVNGLTVYQDRLPPLLEGKTKAQMRDIIKTENNRLRDWYCSEGE